jgi:L-histidine N-alpha-methyltransferase
MMVRVVMAVSRYYQTRTEHKLLTQVASQIISLSQPSDIVELGSGAARKTRLLFDAVAREAIQKQAGGVPALRFVPYDVRSASPSTLSPCLIPSTPPTPSDLWCSNCGWMCSGEMLANSSVDLCREYPWLKVHGLVATFDHLHAFPTPAPKAANSSEPGNRLVAFIGSTIGNFDVGADVNFLRRVRQQMNKNDWFLIGLDQVKPHHVLNAAYNDTKGL